MNGRSMISGFAKESMLTPDRNLRITPEFVEIKKPDAISLLKKAYSLTGRRVANVSLFIRKASPKKIPSVGEAHESIIVVKSGGKRLLVPAVFVKGRRREFLIAGMSIGDVNHSNFGTVGNYIVPGGVINVLVINFTLKDVIVHFPHLRNSKIVPYWVLRNAPGLSGMSIKTLFFNGEGFLIDGKLQYTTSEGESVWWLGDYTGRTKFLVKPTTELIRDVRGLPVSAEEFFSYGDVEKFYKSFPVVPEFYFKANPFERPLHKAIKELVWIRPMLAPAVYYLHSETTKVFIMTREAGRPGVVEARTVVFRYDGNSFRLTEDYSVKFKGKKRKPKK